MITKRIKSCVYILIIFAVLSGLLSGCTETETNAGTIGQQIIDDLGLKNAELVVYDKQSDPNKLIGEKFGYKSKASIYLAEDRDKYIITIEVFLNEKDAELRNWQFNETYAIEDELYSRSDWGKFLESASMSGDEELILIGNAFIRIRNDNSASYKEKAIAVINLLSDEWKNSFRQLGIKEETEYDLYKVERRSFIEETLVNKRDNFIKEIEKMLDEVELEVIQASSDSDESEIVRLYIEIKAIDIPLFEERTSEMLNMLNETAMLIYRNKKETAKQINNTLMSIEKNRNRDLLEAVEEEIASLTDVFYDEYRDNWEKKLVQLEMLVFKSECKTYRYEDLLRNPDNYYGEKVYFKGKVTQVIMKDNDWISLRIYVTENKSGKKSKWSNDIYVNYLKFAGAENFLEGDIVYLYGTMCDPYTYTTSSWTQRTIPEVVIEYISRSK